MQVSYQWPFNQARISIADDNTETYARWCFTQLSDKAIHVLHDTVWIYYIKNNSWLHPGIAQIFAYHVEPMMPRLNIAILRGKLSAELLKADSVDDQACVIGAAICELLQRGSLSSGHILKEDCRQLLSKKAW